MKNLLKIRLPVYRVTIAIATAIIALIGGSYYYYWLWESESLFPSLPLEHVFSKITPQTKRISIDEPLPLFPYTIPLEPGAPILENYYQTLGNKMQSTRQFISQKSLQENFEIYKRYLKDKNWTIVTTIEKTEIKSISAKKDRLFLSVTMSKNMITNQNVVDITIVGPALSDYSKP